MQVVMNKCFLLNPKKIGSDPSWNFREKRKNRLTRTHSNFEKNDVIESKARLL